MMSFRSTSRTGLLCVTLLSVVIPAAAVLRADEVKRRGEKSATKGDITGASPAEITLKPRTGSPIKIPVGDIERVKFDSEPASLNLARSSESNGQLDRALEGYEKAKAENQQSNPLLKADIDFLIARVTASLAFGDSTKVDDAIAKLDAFKNSNANSFRLYESLDLLGRLYTQKNDVVKAREVFLQLGNSPLKTHQMAAKVAEGRLLLLEENLDGALSAFETVAGMQAAGPAEQTRQQEAVLGKATVLQKQKKYDEAVAVLDNVIQQAAAQETRIQAEAYLRQGDCYREQQKVKDAVLAYLHVDVLFPAEKALHAESLFNLANLWGPAGHQDRAAEATARLTSEYPNSAWAKKLQGG